MSIRIISGCYIITGRTIECCRCAGYCRPRKRSFSNPTNGSVTIHNDCFTICQSPGCYRLDCAKVTNLRFCDTQGRLMLCNARLSNICIRYICPSNGRGKIICFCCRTKSSRNIHYITRIRGRKSRRKRNRASRSRIRRGRLLSHVVYKNCKIICACYRMIQGVARCSCSCNRLLCNACKFLYWFYS